MMSAFPPIFVMTFALVLVYLGCVFALGLRLRSKRTYSGPDPFSFFGSAQIVGWFFSGKHRSLDDAMVSRLVWAARILFVVLIPLYVSTFASLWGSI